MTKHFSMMSNLPDDTTHDTPYKKMRMGEFWYHLAFVFYLLPKKYRRQEPFGNQLRATDTDKFILFVLLAIGEVLVHMAWYFVMLFLEAYGDISHLVVANVLWSMAWFASSLFSLSIVFIIGILFVPENSQRWLWLQGLYVFIYLCYGISFAFAFGENTSAVAVMFLGSMTLGLFLLRWRFILGTYIVSILVLTVFLIDKNFNYLENIPSLLPDTSVYTHSLWQISYLYFVVPKATMTVLGIAQVLRVLEMQEKTIYQLSEIDYLTNVYNRRSIYVYLDYLWQYRTSWHSIGMVYFDLDKFKSINDNFGHAMGDKVLIHSVQIIRQLLPKGAIFGRLGGEEFVIILPNLEQPQIQLLTEQIRQRLQDSPIDLLDKQDIAKNNGDPALQITASFGVACMYRITQHKLTKARLRFSKYLRQKATVQLTMPVVFDKLVNRADEAMYQAKETGRNRIVYARSLQFEDNI